MKSADKSAQALAQEEVLSPVHTYIVKLKQSVLLHLKVSGDQRRNIFLTDVT